MRIAQAGPALENEDRRAGVLDNGRGEIVKAFIRHHARCRLLQRKSGNTYTDTNSSCKSGKIAVGRQPCVEHCSIPGPRGAAFD